MKYALTIWGLAFAILLAGCATGPDPSEILNRSHDAMREVQSYRFSGESESKIQGEVMGGRQSGAWAAPDQWYVMLEFLGDHAGQGGETLVVGQRVYNREFDSNDGAWREVTHLLEGQAVYNPRPESNLAVPDLENLRLREDVVVDGRATF